MADFKCYYFYTLFEVGNKGYVLKEKYLPINFIELEQQEYCKLSDLIDDKLHQGTTEKELLEDVGYLFSYDIYTHRAVIRTDCLCTVLISGLSKNKRNSMYLLFTDERTNNFTQFSRDDPSKELIFLEYIEGKYIKDALTEIFLN